MPLAKVRGVNMNYKVLGNHGPWVALSPGGRRDISGIELLAGKVAETGHRVVVFDRRNCGASDVVIDGQDSEYEIFMSCSDNSVRFPLLSAAAPPAAGLRSYLRCDIRKQ
jgi:pimeloyl-ACP methyl ester carboxylesterase